MANLNKADKARLMSFSRDDLTCKMVTRLFGKHTRREAGKFEVIPPEFNLGDRFDLEAGEFTNKEKVNTSVGIYLFNKLLVEGCIDSVVPNGYYNEIVTKKKFMQLLDFIAYALQNKQISINPYIIDFYRRYEYYTMKLVTVFSPSYTEGLLRTPKATIEYKEKVLQETEIKNVQDMSAVEDKIVSFAREQLKGDPGMTLFDSGARGSFDNDYKNMNLIRGPVGTPGTNEFTFVTSNLIDGFEKKDIVAAGNMVVNAAFPKAVKCA